MGEVPLQPCRLFELLLCAFRFRAVSRNVDERLRGKGISNAHGARPVHLIITMMTWIRTSRLSMKKSLSLEPFDDSNPKPETG